MQIISSVQHVGEVFQSLKFQDNVDVGEDFAKNVEVKTFAPNPIADGLCVDIVGYLAKITSIIIRFVFQKGNV